MKNKNVMAALALLMLAGGLGLQYVFPDGWLTDFLSGLMIGGSIVINAVIIATYKGPNKLREYKKKIFCKG